MAFWWVSTIVQSLGILALGGEDQLQAWADKGLEMSDSMAMYEKEAANRTCTIVDYQMKEHDRFYLLSGVGVTATLLN